MFERNDEIIALLHMEATTGKEEELLTAIQARIEPSQKESGCLQYEMVQSVEDPKQITLIGRFTSYDAFLQHLDQSYIKKLDQQIKSNLVNTFDLKLYNSLKDIADS